MPTPLELAQTMVGTAEGQAKLNQYLKTGGQGLDPVALAWCAAFVNSTLKQGGYGTTGSNMARSFLNYGQPVDTPNPGDIAVFPRGNDPAKGHVGFVQSYDPATGGIKLLAGNQGNAVSVADYNAKSALGFRRPSVAAPPGSWATAAGTDAGPAHGQADAGPADGSDRHQALAAKKDEDEEEPRDILAGAIAGMGGTGARAARPQYVQPKAARIDDPTIATIDPQQAMAQRQQMAEIMAKLNAGKLWA